MEMQTDVQLDTTIAPITLHMCTKLGPFSPFQSRDIHLQMNLGNYPQTDLKYNQNGTYFVYSNVTISHNYIENITPIYITLINCFHYEWHHYKAITDNIVRYEWP